MATVTDLASIAAATAPGVGYILTTYQKTVQGQLLNVVRLEKQLNPIAKAASGWFGGYGENASLTTAKTNALANAAAAVSAGYIKTNTDRGTGGIGAGGAPIYPASERFQTSFSKDLAGPSGEAGIHVEFIGFGVDQNTAEIQALANLNAWRINRYGGDSAAANAANTNPAQNTAAGASKKHTKDST